MKLPRDLPARRCVKALGRLGFRPLRQAGSHLSLWNDATRRLVVVPMHAALDTGTPAEILHEAGVTRQAFLESL